MKYLVLITEIFVAQLFGLFAPIMQYVTEISYAEEYRVMDTTVTEERIIDFKKYCPTLYGNGEIPIVIIYTHYTNIHEMNLLNIVDFALWENGKVIWNKGDHKKVDYHEKILSKESLKRSIQSLKQVIPWRQQLEYDLSLEGFPTTTFAEIDGERFFYNSEQCFGTTELAWSSSAGWKLYARRQVGNDIPFSTEAGEEVDKNWTPPRPLNAISLTNRILACFPLDNSKQIDVLFFPEISSASMRIYWEDSTTLDDARNGKWRNGIIRSGSPWWNEGSPYWNEAKEKEYKEYIEKDIMEKKQRDSKSDIRVRSNSWRYLRKCRQCWYFGELF